MSKVKNSDLAYGSQQKYNQLHEGGEVEMEYKDADDINKEDDTLKEGGSLDYVSG